MKKVRILTGLILLAVLLSSHWFRISVRIPFKGDGDTNMAVTFAEWRKGTSMLKERLTEGDFVLSTVPLLSRFYGVEASANLNQSLLDQAQYEKFRDSQGRWVDVYLGLECIESAEELDKVIQDNEEGWVIGERYHFNSPQYISREIRDILFGRMGEPLSTGKGTLWIFHWKNPESVH